MVLGIYGAGGLGREVYELALDIQESRETRRWDKIVFIADYSDCDTLREIPILAFNQFMLQFPQEKAEIVIAVGEPRGRTALRERVVQAGYSLATLVHPQARISRWASFGAGCVITYGCNVSCETSIGSNCYLQPSCGVGHDTRIGEDCVISAGVRIAGNALVGDKSFVGLHSTVREHVSVGRAVIIGMGSVVQRDIPDAVIATGNPARVIQKNDDQKVF